MKLRNVLAAAVATFALSAANAQDHDPALCPDGGAGASSAECGNLEGSIDVFGEVPICVNLSVLDTNGEFDFDNLGNAEINEQKVGQFTVDSNAPEGFSLTFSSAASGEMQKIGGTGSDSQKIAYEMDLDRTGGILGAGTAEPAALGSISLESPVTLDFPGSDVAPTVDLTYDVSLSMDKKHLQPGVYSDTITVQMAAL